MKRSIKDIDLKGKKVLVRVDFNVPLDGFGQITDDNRIRAALPTINHLLKQGCRVILCSHLGKPKGIDPKYSLYPVAQRLIQLLLNKIYFAIDVVGPDAIEKAGKLKEGEILLLENLRFEAGEEKNDIELATKLSDLAEFYVNDAFGTAHRKHASTYGVAQLLPNAVGFLMGKEVSIIEQILSRPKRPFIAIMGGAKISDKIKVIRNLLNKVNVLIIGGGMAYTFLKAMEHEIGTSLVDKENIGLALELLELAKEKKVKVYLPIDHIVTSEIRPGARGIKTKDIEIPYDKMGVDIGPQTVKLFTIAIENAKTVVWNGPLGVYEYKAFAKGSVAIARAVAKLKEKGGITFIGGGDAGAVIAGCRLSKKVTHVSTGGGASLEMLEGETLPGIDIISNIDPIPAAPVKNKKISK